jgi:hypothetical protein
MKRHKGKCAHRINVSILLSMVLRQKLARHTSAPVWMVRLMDLEGAGVLKAV